MIIPKYLNDNDIIAFSSPSNGITNKKIDGLEKSIKILNENNFEILEDKNTRSSINGESAPASLRAKELNKLIRNKKNRLILSVTGGDYLIEILDKLNFDYLKNNIKWFQGQSDTTLLLFLLTTKYNIKTIYSFNAATLSKASDIEINNNIRILKGESIMQNDFKYKICNGKKQNSNWVSTKKINITGRIIGGSMSCIMDIIGTNYDNTINFIEKYKKDGIIWYFDIDYISNEELLRNLWHLKNCGWFKHTKCIIFGRNEEETYTGINLNDAIKRGVGNSIPYVTNFDLGHTFPRVTIVNGSIVNLKCDGKDNFIKIIDEGLC